MALEELLVERTVLGTFLGPVGLEAARGRLGRGGSLDAGDIPRRWVVLCYLKSFRFEKVRVGFCLLVRNSALVPTERGLNSTCVSQMTSS